MLQQYLEWLEVTFCLTQDIIYILSVRLTHIYNLWVSLTVVTQVHLS